MFNIQDRLLLTNEVVVLEIKFQAQTQRLAERLAAFLAPYFFDATDDSVTPDLTIQLIDNKAFKQEWIVRCVQLINIRLSHAPGFSLKVLVGEDNHGHRIAWDAETSVGYYIYSSARRVEFFGGEESFIHLIELVRYFSLRVEESRGTLVMHAAAVYAPSSGNVVALAGLKGAGKTTSMFAEVAGGEAVYFSGDKLLLDLVDDRIRARGWPDFPYIGAGTLRAHPELAARLKLSSILDDIAIPAQQKFLVDPLQFKSVIPSAIASTGELKGIILPDVSYVGNSRIPRLSASEVKEALEVPGTFEYASEFLIATWHGIEPKNAICHYNHFALIRSLSALPWYRRDGINPLRLQNSLF